MNAQIIPSHQVADWLLTNIKHFLDYIGLSHDKTIEEIVYVAMIVGAALLIGWLVRRGILLCARKFVKMRKSPGAKLLLQQRVLTKCSHIIPPLVILALLPFAFDSSSRLLVIFEKCLYIYTAIVFAIGLNAVLTFIWTRVDERENTKNLPLKGILNICVGLVWIIVAIVSISVVVDKSPAMLLAGLGVFASALMLVFKDTILGFVAGIQLAENDMLHVGDWIVVPSTIANGIVEDVSLSAVKVRNWDNTIVTLPPYTLISTSFQNWRGMSSSGWRQIARSVIFDAYYIKKCDSELLEKVTTLHPELKGFIEDSQKRGKPDYNPGLAVVNGTIDTNLG
ncbi:MAG: mechanosensitive ion channel family protein, partial [Paramuribaculum sp.]|nr:mechanosensitive ion channel family protein [Paramuribaculum sp.]